MWIVWPCRRLTKTSGSFETNAWNPRKSDPLGARLDIIYFSSLKPAIGFSVGLTEGKRFGCNGHFSRIWNFPCPKKSHTDLSSWRCFVLKVGLGCWSACWFLP